MAYNGEPALVFPERVLRCEEYRGKSRELIKKYSEINKSAGIHSPGNNSWGWIPAKNRSKKRTIAIGARRGSKGVCGLERKSISETIFGEAHIP